MSMINSMPTWWWVVYALAVMRLTGLVAKDEITRPIREALVSRLDTSKGWHRKIAYLVGGATDEGDGCPWCLSLWIAAPVVPAAWYYGDQPWMIIPAAVLAISQITGMTAAIGRG
jgi:hypothetical protein